MLGTANYPYQRRHPEGIGAGCGDAPIAPLYTKTSSLTADSAAYYAFGDKRYEIRRYRARRHPISYTENFDLGRNPSWMAAPVRLQLMLRTAKIFAAAANAGSALRIKINTVSCTEFAPARHDPASIYCRQKHFETSPLYIRTLRLENTCPSSIAPPLLSAIYFHIYISYFMRISLKRRNIQLNIVTFGKRWRRKSMETHLKVYKQVTSVEEVPV